MSTDEIEKFVSKHEKWIKKHIAAKIEHDKKFLISDEEKTVLKAKALPYLTERTEYFSKIMGVKPTGIKITSAQKRFGSCNGKNSYKKMSGTSMATPVVSAAIALLLEKNPDMTPKDVKYCLYKTAKDCGYSKQIQGWGRVDVARMMKY